MNGTWEADPKTGDLYFRVGPFHTREESDRFTRMITSFMTDQSFNSRDSNKLRFEDGTVTQMGRAMLWLEQAGEAGMNTRDMERATGRTKEGANHVLRRLHESGYAERIPSVPGRGVVYRAIRPEYGALV